MVYTKNVDQSGYTGSVSSYAIVCVSLRAGGTERIVARVANHLVMRAPVKIITLAATPAFYPLDSSIHILKPPAAWRSLSKPLKALCLFKYLSANLSPGGRLLVFGEEITGWVALLARMRGQRDIWLFNRGTPARSLSGWGGRLNRMTYRFASRVVVQTRQAIDYLAKHAPSARTAMWANPIEIPEAIPSQRHRRKLIAMVGSIGRNKNQRALIEAFLATSAQANGWRLWLIGDGPQRKELEAYVNQLGATSTVEFLGERSNADRLLMQVSIFAFTSRSEGFPNALAEAQAAGCACIAYDCPTGPSELITDGVSGRLIPLDAEDQFAEALDELVMDMTLREQLAVGARNQIKQMDQRHSLKLLDDLMREH